MNKISRNEAIGFGLNRYFTGLPCPHGHIAERRTHDCRCMECRKLDKEKEQKSEAWRVRTYHERRRYKELPENKIKDAAHRKVERAINKGILVRLPCEVCGSTKRVHGHHDDYSKPLDVIWLCGPHHRQRHLSIDILSPHLNLVKE